MPTAVVVRSRPGARARCRLAVAALVATTCLAAAAGLGGLGCGDNSVVGDDAGSTGAYSLVILDPPGDTIGLPPSSEVTLRVRYLDDMDGPIAGAPVTFTVLPGELGSGGASLSATTALTDGDGVAAVDLVLGVESLDFQIAADAGNAPRATFYVMVSDQGFATLEVTPAHAGFRAATDFAGVELRLFRGRATTCASIDPDAPDLPGTLPPRRVAGFGQPAVWQSISAYAPYVVLAWGVHVTSGRAVALGCADLGAAALPPGRVRLALELDDRAPALPATMLASRFDLAPLTAAIAAHDADASWRQLACPSGPGQLVLDWIVDALADDGVLDGVVTGPGTPRTVALELRRGARGADGCRAATRVGGGASLDATTTAILAAGDFPAGPGLAALISRRAAGFAELDVVSALVPAAGGRLWHHLEAARLGVGSDDVVIDLRGSTRPVIGAIVDGWVGGDGGLVLGDHGFTLRIGSLLGAGFAGTALADAGLGERGGELGQALAGAARHDDLEGCAAIDALACAAIVESAGCLGEACAIAAGGLDGALTAWWRVADGAALDLRLRGAGAIHDVDGDLIADGLVTPGTWTATLVLADATEVASPGSFVSTLATEPAPPP